MTDTHTFELDGVRVVLHPRTLFTEMVMETMRRHVAMFYDDMAAEHGVPQAQFALWLVGFLDIASRVVETTGFDFVFPDANDGEQEVRVKVDAWGNSGMTKAYKALTKFVSGLDNPNSTVTGPQGQERDDPKAEQNAPRGK